MIFQNNYVPGFWIDNPDNYSDSNIKVSSDGDGGYYIDPAMDGCNLRFYAKIDDIFSKIAIFVNKEQYGEHLNGLCGNCNDVVDEYDSLPDGNSLYAPINITASAIVPSTVFPPNPSR